MRTVPFSDSAAKTVLGLGRVFDAQRHGKALGLLEAVRRRIGTHQHGIADNEPGVHDLTVHVAGRMRGGWRLAVRQHHQDLAAKALLIEFERRRHSPR